MPLVYKAGLAHDELDALEEAISVAVPQAYREFLGRMNGFFLSAPDFGQLPLKSVESGVIAFDRFFGVAPEEECNDLICFNDEFISELGFSGEALAIGEDGGGNPYVLVTGAGHEGVYYWDRTHLHESCDLDGFDVAEQEGCGALYEVAIGFDEFYSLIMASLPDDIEFMQES